MLDILSDSVVKTSCTIPGTSVGDTRQWWQAQKNTLSLGVKHAKRNKICFIVCQMLYQTLSI